MSVFISAGNFLTQIMRICAGTMYYFAKFAGAYHIGCQRFGFVVTAVFHEHKRSTGLLPRAYKLPHFFFRIASAHFHCNGNARFECGYGYLGVVFPCGGHQNGVGTSDGKHLFVVGISCGGYARFFFYYRNVFFHSVGIYVANRNYFDIVAVAKNVFYKAAASCSESRNRHFNFILHALSFSIVLYCIVSQLFC